MLHIHSIDPSDRRNAKSPGKTIFPGRSGAIAANLIPATLFNAAERQGFPAQPQRNGSGPRLFSPSMHGVDDGCAQEACIFTPSPGTKSPGTKSTGSKNTCADDRATGRAKTLVAARHERERRARSASRRVQADQREEDRGLAEAFGGTQRAPQIRRLSLGAVDADLLHQPRRQEF